MAPGAAADCAARAADAARFASGKGRPGFFRSSRDAEAPTRFALFEARGDSAALARHLAAALASALLDGVGPILAGPPATLKDVAVRVRAAPLEEPGSVKCGYCQDLDAPGSLLSRTDHASVEQPP